MDILHKIKVWSNTHQPQWLVFVRVALGLCLFFRGIMFLNNSVQLETILLESPLASIKSWLVLFITWAHLLGGFLIIIGLLTRWATLLQIPILTGAVIFVNAPKGIFAAQPEFGFSLIVLLLLILFFIEGGGPISLDNYFKNNPK